MDKDIKYKTSILSFFTKEVSLSAFLLSVMAILFLHADNQHGSILSWDTFGYYLYLPANLIHHDPYILDYSWLDALFRKYEISSTFYQAVKWESGKWIIRYTPGMAVLYLPFFLIGHLFALLGGYATDGMSAPYQYAVSYGLLLYPIGGLWALRHWLKKYLSDKVAGISLIVLVFGTNLLHMAAENHALTHVPLFALYAWYILNLDKYLENRSKTALFVSAALAGLIILIRPTEAAMLLLPFLWKNNPLQIISFIKESFRRLPAFLPAAIIAACIVFPMLLYWKGGSGEWFINSYRNPAEGLDFRNPYLKEFLFSFRKGWLVYTPIGLFMVFGILIMWKRKISSAMAMSIFAILSIYIYASWTCWWYAGACYSQRTMVQTYALLSLPMAFSIDAILRQKSLIRISLSGMLLLLILFNLFQMWQFNHNIIDHDRMTGEAYQAVFLKTQKPRNLESLLLVNRSTGAEESISTSERLIATSVYVNDFEKDSTAIEAAGLDGSKAGEIGAKREFFDLYRGVFNQITDKYYFWLRINFSVFIPEDYTEDSPGIVVHFENEEGVYKYRHHVVKNRDLKKGAWNEISMDYQSPEPRKYSDRMKAYLWHPSKQALKMDQIYVTLFQPDEENPTP